MVEKIRAKGLAMCKPEILPSENREIFAKGVYNLKLGIKRVNGEEFNIVANDIDFDDESGRIYILTGPNRGGKTTFTQAVGLAVLLAQNGIYAPCRELKISPCDNILRIFRQTKTTQLTWADLAKKAKDLRKFLILQPKTVCFCLMKALQPQMYRRVCLLQKMSCGQCVTSE